MIETRHGTIRISYRQGKRRRHVIAHFIQGASPFGAASIFQKDELIPNASKSFKVYTGDVACDSRDRFVRKEGRRKAIKKALELAGFDRKDRVEIWDDIRKVMRVE